MSSNMIEIMFVKAAPWQERREENDHARLACPIEPTSSGHGARPNRRASSRWAGQSDADGPHANDAQRSELRRADAAWPRRVRRYPGDCADFGGGPSYRLVQGRHR